MATGNENYKVIPAVPWPQAGDPSEQQAAVRGVYDFLRRFLAVLDQRDRELSKAINSLHDFIDRGDTSSQDWTEATLTADGDTHDLDLGAIVPVGAKAVLLEISVLDGAVGSYLMVFRKGHTGINRGLVRTQVAGNRNDREAIVALSDDRKISYKASNTTFDGIAIAVKGWFV